MQPHVHVVRCNGVQWSSTGRGGGRGGGGGGGEGEEGGGEGGGGGGVTGKGTIDMRAVGRGRDFHAHGNVVVRTNQYGNEHTHPDRT